MRSRPRGPPDGGAVVSCHVIWASARPAHSPSCRIAALRRRVQRERVGTRETSTASAGTILVVSKNYEETSPNSLRSSCARSTRDAGLHALRAGGSVLSRARRAPGSTYAAARNRRSHRRRFRTCVVDRGTERPCHERLPSRVPAAAVGQPRAGSGLGAPAAQRRGQPAGSNRRCAVAHDVSSVRVADAEWDRLLSYPYHSMQTLAGMFAVL